ncbi:hypothetical protein KEM52_000218, partial [Ascosphaera acerosa]
IDMAPPSVDSDGSSHGSSRDDGQSLLHEGTSIASTETSHYHHRYGAGHRHEHHELSLHDRLLVLASLASRLDEATGDADAASPALRPDVAERVHWSLDYVEKELRLLNGDVEVLFDRDSRSCGPVPSEVEAGDGSQESSLGCNAVPDSLGPDPGPDGNDGGDDDDDDDEISRGKDLREFEDGDDNHHDGSSNTVTALATATAGANARSTAAMVLQVDQEYYRSVLLELRRLTGEYANRRDECIKIAAALRRQSDGVAELVHRQEEEVVALRKLLHEESAQHEKTIMSKTTEVATLHRSLADARQHLLDCTTGLEAMRGIVNGFGSWTERSIRSWAASCEKRAQRPAAMRRAHPAARHARNPPGGGGGGSSDDGALAIIDGIETWFREWRSFDHEFASRQHAASATLQRIHDGV